jgi:hypothetical protein
MDLSTKQREYCQNPKKNYHNNYQEKIRIEPKWYVDTNKSHK